MKPKKTVYTIEEFAALVKRLNKAKQRHPSKPSYLRISRATKVSLSQVKKLMDPRVRLEAPTLAKIAEYLGEEV